MTDTQHPGRADDNSLLPGLVKGGAIAGTLTWALILLAFIVALNSPGGGGLGALGPLLALIVATSIFGIFVLPALLFSFLGGQSGAKVGAGFLVGGLLVVAVVLAGPILLLALVVATPIFVIFVLPASIISYVRRRRSSLSLSATRPFNRS